MKIYSMSIKQTHSSGAVDVQVVHDSIANQRYKSFDGTQLNNLAGMFGGTHLRRVRPGRRLDGHLTDWFQFTNKGIAEMFIAANASLLDTRIESEDSSGQMNSEVWAQCTAVKMNYSKFLDGKRPNFSVAFRLGILYYCDTCLGECRC